jgi:RHS Repeat
MVVAWCPPGDAVIINVESKHDEAKESVAEVPRLVTAQAAWPEESSATMSDRQQRGLRGPVKSCTEESTYSGATDAGGKTYPEVHSEYTTEYDKDGRIASAGHINSDGSQWIIRYLYDDSGWLLKTASGVEGQVMRESTYSYDHQGRLQSITDDARPDSPITFRYDERGRKIKIEISGSADYRPNMAVAGSPFEVADRAPNLPGGGSATTIYDEHDRPIEVEVRDAEGELVNRAVRNYDAEGHIFEEKQILDNPETMIPVEAREKIAEESGLSLDQLQLELHMQLTKLMAGQSGPYSVTYAYDTQGRMKHMSRRIFGHQEEIESTYNEHGDLSSEVTRSTGIAEGTDPATPAAALPSYSEAHYSYKYDNHENWVEKAISHRSNPDGSFQPSTVVKRTLMYY